MESQSVSGLEEVPASVRSCVLTIGNFDGVHIGHQRILLACRSAADRARVPVVALTFNPMPKAVLYPMEAVPPQIYLPEENARLLGEAGADLVVTIRPTRELLGMSPRAFMEKFILARLAPVEMVEGANFFFGHARAGSVVTLENIGASCGFGVEVVDPVVIKLNEGPRRVSSTLIRELVAEGRVEDANFCLGRPFALTGEIVAGEARGRQLEFPTANLNSTGQVLPGDGVYAAKAAIGQSEFAAAVSVGVKPTFGGGPRVVEAFLLDARGDFYGQQMTLKFLKRLRGQTRFEDAEALRQQIARDVEEVRAITARQ